MEEKMSTPRIGDNLPEEELRRRLAQNQQDWYELIAQARGRLEPEVVAGYERGVLSPSPARVSEEMALKLKEYDSAVDWHSYRPHDVNREADQHKAAAKLAEAVRRFIALSSDNPDTTQKGEG